MDLVQFNKLPIMGIIRGLLEKDLEALIQTIISSGLKTIEITLNTPDADVLIKKAVELSKNQLMIGAGTVRTLGDLETALNAGASFIVTPHFDSNIVKECVSNSIPVFPGALTPQEIHTAWAAGATMVKVFPSSVFGPKYFKEIHGPFEEIKLLACGGVTSQNIKEYFNMGASAIAFGGSIFNIELINNKQFTIIESKIKGLIETIRP